MKGINQPSRRHADALPGSAFHPSALECAPDFVSGLFDAACRLASASFSL
jgi:hypothetical protein